MKIAMLRPLSTASRAVALAAAVVVALGVVTLVILTALGALVGTAKAAGPPSNPRSTAHARGSSAARGGYYVSLGDSYAVGFQPAPAPGPTSGFTGVVAHDTGLRLVNFGCGGATTTSILEVAGCTAPYGPTAKTDGAPYPGQPQASAAVAFLRAHRGHVGLVTVVIGGNDVTHCAQAADPTTCVFTALDTIRTNVTALAKELRAAVGPHVPILGLTYPDVLLGSWVYPSGHADRALATLSVAAFKSLINPTLAKAYAGGGATFVDVTKDTDAYVPLSRTTALAPYGSIPVAVAKVCTLTWYCQVGNIHAKSSGYRVIGAEVVHAYRRAHGRRSS